MDVVDAVDKRPGSIFRSLVDIRQHAKSNALVDIREEAPLGEQLDLLQGTLDLLILKTLALGPMHGWGISQRIQQVSQEVLQVGQGSLYPALTRLEQRGWIGAEWSTSDNNRRAKFYSLTKAGARQLKKELGEWERLSAAIALVLEQS
jgi:PadR family transcriptional regulator PadR